MAELEPQLGGRDANEVSFLLSSQRTRLSFQRTRMSSDRTLMSIVRTSLSLIGFGFTIYQFFCGLRAAEATREVVGAAAARNFGVALVLLGLLILTLGMAATHTGMTTDEFGRSVQRWIDSAKHPRTGRLYTDMVYQPVLELLAPLRGLG
jgi:uncharacterized membrane protein YidH (DUF202 family)